MAKAVYTLEVTITEGLMFDDFVRDNPVISRTIEIRGDQTLNQLHKAILQAFDRWDDCHLHEFHFGKKPRERHARRYVMPFILDDPDEEPAAGSVTTTRMGRLDLNVGSVFWYWYDFGDDWYHEIKVLAVGEVEPKAKYPRVVATIGESPPQYRQWDDDDPDEGDELAAEGTEPQRVLGWLPITEDVTAGTTSFADGSVVEWRHEVLSPEEASLMADHAFGQTYRVTAMRELPDGTIVVSTYLVPGAWLNACVRELGRGESETVLSVEVV